LKRIEDGRTLCTDESSQRPAERFDDCELNIETVFAHDAGSIQNRRLRDRFDHVGEVPHRRFVAANVHDELDGTRPALYGTIGLRGIHERFK
jgi:hypothetical protein